MRGIKDFWLYAQLVIRTENVVISGRYFAEDCTDLFLSACRTCSAFIFPHSTNQILNEFCGVAVTIAVVTSETP